MNKQEQAIDRILTDILKKDDLTTKDIDTLLKTMTIQATIDRQANDSKKIDKEFEMAKYQADKRLEEAKIRAEAESKNAKYQADKRLEEATIKAEADKANAESSFNSAELTANKRLEEATIRANSEFNAATYAADKRLQEATIKAEADRERTQTEAESAKYTADQRYHETDRRAIEDYNIATMQARTDSRSSNKQLIGGILATVGTVAGTVLTTAATIALFNEGLTFEQTGIFTSSTTKSLLTTGLNLIRRR